MSEQQPEIPTIIRDMQRAQLALGAKDGMVVVYVAEIHEGDDAPIATEAFPIAWQIAKPLFLQAYMLACGMELEATGGQGGAGTPDE